MRTVFKLAAAFAAGALAMYYFDPRIGRRRRAYVRGKGVTWRHRLEEAARARSTHPGDRLQGAAAHMRARTSPEPVDDDLLRDRIRSRLGHLVDRSGVVHVDVHDGHVVLSGSASAAEIDEMVQTVAAMHGVAGVDNRLAAAGAPGRAARH